MEVSGMRQAKVKPVKISKSEKDSNIETKKEKEIEGYEMIIGRSKDSKEARTRWMETVEKILENESFEKAQQHTRKNFENPTVNQPKTHEML